MFDQQHDTQLLLPPSLFPADTVGRSPTLLRADVHALAGRLRHQVRMPISKRPGAEMPLPRLAMASNCELLGSN